MINYFFEEVPSFTVDIKISTWLERLTISEGKKMGAIQYIFCDDEYLLKVNIEYLNHDFYTDIITFDYVKGNKISGDIYVSLPRISENALAHSKAFNSELHRVLAHGLLHLCGYKDNLEEEKLVMRNKEEFYLNSL